MKLRELPGTVSPAAPRKASLLLQRIGEERRGWEREKKNGRGKSPPPTMQNNNNSHNSKIHSEREGERERDRVKLREHEAIERLFILSLPGVATDSGIKIEPIAVNMRSVSPRGKQRRREIQSEREWERYNSHEVSVSFLSEEKSSPGKGKVLSHRLTDCLHRTAIPSLHPPLCHRPPFTTHPNGAVMTSSGVNREACTGLIQSEGGNAFPQTFLSGFASPSHHCQLLITHTPCNHLQLTVLASVLSAALSRSRGRPAKNLPGGGRAVRSVKGLQGLVFREESSLASQQQGSQRCKQVLPLCSKLGTLLCDCLPIKEFQSST